MRSIPIASALIATALACNGGDTVGEPTDVVTEVATAVCDRAFSCCTRGEVNLLLGPQVAEEDCVDRLVRAAETGDNLSIDLSFLADVAITLPNLSVLQRAIDDKRVEVQSNALSECVIFIESLNCREPEPPPDGSCVPPPEVFDTPCDPDTLFLGKVGEGGVCSSIGLDLECAEGLTCSQFDSLGVEGACVQAGQVDDFCFDDNECDNDLYCSLADGTCQVPAGVGEPCLYGDPDPLAPDPTTLLIQCAVPLSCDPITDTCVTACGRGAPCAIDPDCGTDGGLVCIIGRCDTPRELGGPCAEPLDCQASLRCAFDPLVTTTLVCQERLADGEQCNISIGDADCESGWCDNLLATCQPPLATGNLCPSNSDAECSGYCESEIIACQQPGDCASGSCGVTGVCEGLCVDLAPEGGVCLRDTQCTTGDCVAGFCRTLPLADGQDCFSNFECGSGFCGFDVPRVCESLPLDLGQSCSIGAQCGSGVCFGGICDPGLGEGQTCGAGMAPCSIDFFCSATVCAPVTEAGEECLDSLECRGLCVIESNRTLCDATASPLTAICDGQ